MEVTSYASAEIWRPNPALQLRQAKRRGWCRGDADDL